MAYPTIGGTTISSGVTVVDCQKQVRSWRLLRSLIELLTPCCNGTFIEDHHDKLAAHHYHHQTKQQQNFFQTYFFYPQPTNVTTGTFFGYRKGKVSFCIQTTSKSSNHPILLLELAVSTQTLAREMRGGFLRIALESNVPFSSSSGARCDDLLSTPVWTMYCNGRKVGYAVKKRLSETDMEALRLMGSVVAGAGVIRGKEVSRDDDDKLMYLRAKFERVCGSENSESFHLIDPDRRIGQELSVFFYRSR